MRGRIFVALCLGLMMADLAAAPADPEEAALLERAQLWQSRNRDDLAREFLDRLFRISPDNPDGLLLQARLQVRAGNDAEAARIFERLREAHPGHPAVAQLAALLRIRGADRERLRQARQLARAGRTEEALGAFRALFPDVFPDDEMELEYAQLLAASREGKEEAGRLFADLAGRNAEDPKFRLALARHRSRSKPIGPETLRALRELSAVPSVSRQARDAWRSAVLGLDAVEENLPALREYVAHEPGDTAAAERLGNVTQAVERQRRLLADPASIARREGLALLEEGRLDAAEARLREAIGHRANDAEAIGGMGLLRLRQGRHAEAGDHFAKARSLDAAGRARWEGLIRTARYWDLLQRAKLARESGQLEHAERQLREARSLDPAEPNSAIDLARVHEKQSRDDDAERLYREALALAPGNANALDGLIALLLRAGRDREAETRMEGLAPGKRREIIQAIKSMRAGRLREKGDALTAQGRSREAIAALEEAAAIDEDDPWMRLDLARLYAAAGEAERGRELLVSLVGRRPGDADSAFAMALYLSGVDRESEALTTLDRVAEADRTAGMARLQRRIWVSVQGRRAAALASGGQQGQAARILAAAREAIGGDADLALELAGAFAGIGDFAAAQDLLARFSAAPAQPSLEWRIGQARLLNRMDADAQLRGVLDGIAALGWASQAQAEEIADLRLALSLRQVEALRVAGKPAKALQLLKDARPARPTPAQEVRHGYARARVLRALARREEAAEVLRDLVRTDPKQDEARLALVELLVESGQRDPARREIAQLLRTQRQDDADLSVALARNLIALGDFSDARPLVDAALQANSDHPQALSLAGQLALREGRNDQAIEFQQRSLASEMSRRPPGESGRLSMLEPSAVPGGALSTVAAPAGAVAAQRVAGDYRQLARLLDQETGWLSAALDWRSRDGTRGKSRLSAQELPVEFRQGWSSAGRWFFRADAARVSSGAIDLADAGESVTFGSVLLCQPLCGSGTLPQEAKGLAFSAGLSRGGMQLDVGTSPLGFPVFNLLGGIAYKGDLGPASYSLEASRRPVASSLLSYAGAKDPFTGREWGGVVATGARVGLSRDSGGDFGAWSSLELHRLGGKNVQDNDRAQLMAGMYRRFINEDDRLLTAGVTGMLWRFSENAGEFTFGHGGYYSPRSYRSLSLPLTFGMRGARTSFVLRASVSVSWSEATRAPFFPTDGELQAQAEARAPLNFIDPHFEGGTGGRSYGRSLAAGWEHQLFPRVFVGGRIELERSTNYTPNRFLFYVRLSTDRQPARPVAFPPEPILRGPSF